VAELATAELRKYGLTGWLPTFVTDAGGNVRKAMTGTMRGTERSGGMADWGRCCCHIMHNTVSGALFTLQARAKTTAGPRTFYEAIQRCGPHGDCRASNVSMVCFQWPRCQQWD
jgi:hypothetical protein